LESLKPQSGEVCKTTTISCCVEPLEKTPEEAEGKELSQCLHLFPSGEKLKPMRANILTH